MKRLLDLVLSSVGLVLGSPIIAAAAVIVWLQDFKSPFYRPARVGKDGRLFRMVKLRSMVVDADKSGVDSTAGNDPRITAVGRIIRKFKLDELTQLWNVLWGDMSLVGPRPNLERETTRYTSEEQKLLSVKPGITDLASIVFADEGEILSNKPDPDLAYHQLIRPWKNRLALLGLAHQSIWLDLRIVFLTALTIFSRERALARVGRILTELGADEQLKKIAARRDPLIPFPPPGATEIVQDRKVKV